jgi:hypothetical protein
VSVRFSIDLSEIAAVQSALEGVKIGVQNRVIKAALRKIASQGLKAAKSNLRVKRTGQLRRSLGLRPRTYQRGAVNLIVIGARRKFRIEGPDGKWVDPTKYAHLVEGGRKANTPTRKRRMAFAVGGNLVFAKRVRAYGGDPFLAPAIPVLKQAADSQFVTDVEAGIAREAAKYAAKGKSIY